MAVKTVHARLAITSFPSDLSDFFTRFKIMQERVVL